jgi:hypothetical protein
MVTITGWRVLEEKMCSSYFVLPLMFLMTSTDLGFHLSNEMVVQNRNIKNQTQTDFQAQVILLTNN